MLLTLFIISNHDALCQHASNFNCVGRLTVGAVCTVHTALKTIIVELVALLEQ